MNMGDISCALLQNSHSILLEYMLEFPQCIDLDVKLLTLDDFFLLLLLKDVAVLFLPHP